MGGGWTSVDDEVHEMEDFLGGPTVFGDSEFDSDQLNLRNQRMEISHN